MDLCDPPRPLMFSKNVTELVVVVANCEEIDLVLRIDVPVVATGLAEDFDSLLLPASKKGRFPPFMVNAAGFSVRRKRSRPN